MFSQFHFVQEFTNQCFTENLEKEVSSLTGLIFEEGRDYDKLLTERKEFHFSSSKKGITEILNSANDKRFALKELIEQTMRGYRLGYTETQGLDNKQFFEMMLEDYDRGHSVNFVLAEISDFREDISSGELYCEKSIVIAEPILTYDIECLIDLFGSCLAERDVLRLFGIKYPDYYGEFNEQYNSSRSRFPTMLDDPTYSISNFEMPFEDKVPVPATESKRDKGSSTTARQVLLMHYIFKEIGLGHVDMSERARVIEFLTGKNFSNIYNCVRNPLKLSEKELRKDLEVVREQIKKLDHTGLMALIDKDFCN